MATAPQFEIKCGTCGYWMPAPAAGLSPTPTPGATDIAALMGTVVQCRKCLQRTTCTSNNARLRVEGGALA